MAKIENLAGTVRNLQLPQIITSLGAKFVEFLPYDYKELANIFIITSVRYFTYKIKHEKQKIMQNACTNQFRSIIW